MKIRYSETRDKIEIIDMKFVMFQEELYLL